MHTASILTRLDANPNLKSPFHIGFLFGTYDNDAVAPRRKTNKTKEAVLIGFGIKLFAARADCYHKGM
ncbi:hypothetical protein BH11ARM2_BH11ARM2_06000 [soil metagenome]